ncbi:MAG: NF038129 family PEP-CTERM protein [Thermoguttaceae bacterium]
MLVTRTRVGGFDPIPPQQVRTIAAEANLAWDRSGGPHNGRVYLAYTDAPAPGNQDTKIFLRYSDDNGMTWSAPVAVSNDKSNSSEFLPSIAVDQSDGDVVVAWYDARNDPNDVKTQFFAAVSSDGGQTFSPNVPVSVGMSDATAEGLNSFAQANQYGDYTGVAFAGGILYPAWTDNSADLPGNPDLPNFDIAEGRSAVAHVADLPLTATPLDISADVKGEGGQFTANLATFTDPDPNAQASYYTATIDWGDPDANTGAADTTTGTIQTDGGGQFTVSGTHVYQAASLYTITITIKDKGGSSVSVTTPALIQDAPLNPGGDVALAAYQGQPFKGIVGTFTDTDPNGAPNDYSTTVDWGDQQQSSGMVTFAGSAALTYDSADNTLYTFGNNDLVDNNPSYLIAISLQGVVTPVSPVDGTFYGGIAFDPVNSTLYALSNAADGVSTLMSYDFSAQTFSPVAVLGSGFTGGLAFNSADGNLYAIAAAGASWEIDQITPATGSVTVLGALTPAGNQPPLSYTGLSFYSDGNAYAVGNDSDGNSTLYRLTIGASVTITSIGQLGNNLTTPPSTQEGFTGGLAAVPADVPGPGSLLVGSLVGISGDGSGTSYLDTIDVDGTASSAFEVYVPAPSGQTKPASGDFSNGFDIIAGHTYAQVMTAALTVLITDVEPSQVPGSVVRSTATDGGTVTVVYPPPQALPAPPAFTAYQGYPTGTLDLASFTVPGGPDTAPGAYSATIDWGDGSLLDTGAIVISGTRITVSGQHTYATSGNFQPTVVLDDTTGGSATVAGAMSVVADLTAAPAPAPFTVFQNDATGTLNLANFSIPTALPGAGSGRYTATIDWGDGGPTTPGTVQITGLTVTVSGSYTYASGGKFQPTVVLQDDTGRGSATLADTVTVLADVTSQVHPVSSGPIYNPLTRLFNGSVTITNTSATPLSGPFPLVFQGLPAGVTLANATGSTGGGIPYVSDALATLPPGQSSTVAVQFQDPQFVPITYGLQIIDPSPVNPLQLVSTIAPRLISVSAVGGVDPSQLSMSADGRYVAFAANASNQTSFGATNPNGGEQVFVRDTMTGTTTLVSVNSTGTGYGDGASESPVISPNGRYVAFFSNADDLVSGSTTGAGLPSALFVRDLQAGTTTEVSVTDDIPIFSGNSQFLVFASTQTNLVTNDTTPGQLFEYNLQTGTTTMVSVDAAGNDGGNAAAYNSGLENAPTVSADGRFIAFGDSATNLVANDTASGYQLFIRDMLQGTTTLITAQPGNYFPQISADGSTVVFTSGVSGIQLYAYDLQTQTTSLVSVVVPGIGGGSPQGLSQGAYQPAVTPDGRYVAYVFVAPGGDQVYVRDLQSNTTVLVSAGLNGGNGNQDNPLTSGVAGTPLISADGRYVVFVSNDTNLVANDAAGNGQLFERDLQLGTTALVTVNDTGTNAGNGPPQAYDHFCMSQDGDYVSFVSSSTDLVPNDYDGGADEVYERGISAQTTVLVSAADPKLPDVTGSTVNISTNPSVSADGRYVAFSSISAQLVTNVPTGGSQIYVRDLQAQTTTLVSIDSAGTSDGSGGYPGYGISQNPTISADGRFVLFESYATNLVANDNLTGLQLYIRDLQTRITSLVSVPLNGTNSGNPAFYQAEISTNDRYVVFQSTATDLVANDAAGGCQVYVRDLQEGTTSLVSVDSAGTNGADNASFAFEYLPEISADGRYVAFQSYSDNLVAGETNPFPGSFDVFERDLQTGVTSLVSVNKAGTASYGSSYLLAMTPDGRYAVFDSSAGDLTANAPHGGVFERDLQQGTTTLVAVGNAVGQSVSSDGRYITFSDGSGVYVRDMQTATTSLVSVEQDGTGISNGVSQYSSISANGQFVLFQSTATNLVSATIASGTTQLYVRDLQTGTTKLVSIAPDGTQSADQSTEDAAVDSAQISADGSTVVFETGADNLVPDFNSSNSIIFAYSTVSFTVPAGVLQVSAVPIHAVEGASFSGGVASFTDTDGDPIGNYTATIAWGDGGTSPGTISANTDGGFNVTGTHTFAEAGFYPIETTVSDSDGSTASASATVVDTGPAGDITYPIEINTSALEGTTGSLAFQFNPGAEPGAQPAVASISNFTITGGSLTSAVVDQGGASGSLAGTAQLTNSAVLNEIQQGITFGGSVSFEITISGAAVEQPGNGDFGSTFAVQLLGTDGVTPQATIDPSGAPDTVDVNPDGSTRVTNFASSAQGGAPVAGNPNVADAPLAATGTSLQASAGTPLTAVIAAFTDANPDAQLTDYAVPAITWGDGQTSTGAITRQSNGTFDVSGTHTYADGGTFTADVTINDLGGSAATASTTIIITSASPAPTTISVNSVTAVYDGQPHGTTAEVYGAGNVDLGPATIIYTQGAIPVDAGSYSLTASFAGNSHYAADTVTVHSAITITPATPTVTAKDDITMYTGAQQAYLDSDVTVTGANGLNGSGGTLSYTYNGSAAIPAAAGSYTVIATFKPTDTTDYTSASGTAALTITRAPLTITAANASRTYGGANPTLSGTIVGLENGDSITATYSTMATPASPVGQYPIVPVAVTSVLGTLNNYTVTLVDGKLTVGKAPLTITAVNKTKGYGAALPTLTASYAGFVNGDTSASLTTQPTLTTTATASSHVAGSPYGITASGAVDSDYAISYVAGTLTVTTAPLTITADSKTKTVGSVNPPLTYTATGFVNGDTTASLTTQPTLTTTATTSSPAGSHPITTSGASDPDYAISYVAGTLTVTAASSDSISGKVYFDVTGNGLTADDTPYAGVKVYLDTNNDGTCESGEPSTLTASDGSYSFTGLAPAKYYVREAVPSGYVRTAPATSDSYCVTLAAGQSSANNNFDNAQLGGTPMLSNIVYLIDGTTPVSDMAGNINEGDTIEVSFTVAAGAPATRYTLVSYTAPGPTFDPNTSGQQKIFATDTGVFGPGSYTLSVSNPHSYFQVDFVTGYAIDHLGPAGSNIFYSAQKRLLNAGNGGTHAVLASRASVSGSVYLDANNNGVFDAGEWPVAGVKLTLIGGSTTQTALTNTYGAYTFDNLPAGTYTITETTPAGYTNGKDTLGNKGGAVSSGKFSGIVLGAGGAGTGYNFGKQQSVGSPYAKNQKQTTAWWNGATGQALIKALNGGSKATSLGTRLAANYGNLFGAAAGTGNNLSGETNAQVAAYYQALYANVSKIPEAEALALALDVYVTNSGLAGTTAASPTYGFAVSATGLATATANVGGSGAAFGINDNAVMTIGELLSRANANARKGLLWDANGDGVCSPAETILRNQLYSLFDTINNK